MTNEIMNTISALKSHNIEAIYCEKKSDIVKSVEDMLFEGAVITNGGSVSVKESGVLELISKEKYNYLDRSRKGITPDEQLEAYKSVIGSDFYFCSSNAVTQNGELINVDGNANRVAAISFGPKRVIMIVGKNKIVKNINEGFLRVKKIAAPLNCRRLCLDTPCAKLGHCVSLERSESPNLADGCNSPNRICIEYLITGYQRAKNRITVIICEEALGY